MFPTSASVGALLSTLLPVFALLRPARLLALLDRSDLERHRSPAAEDFYPSSPAEGHPPRESDIATRRPGADTVTGLSPVGALPLQAARFGEGHDENHFGIAAGRIGQHVRAARDARRRGVHAPIEGRQRLS